jgi:hypothetical protein
VPDSAPTSSLICRLRGAIKSLGEYRDAVLVVASLVYLLGYLSWAFFAAQNNLGLVPALDAQYLVAGVLPTLILAAGVALAGLQLRLSKWSSADPSPNRYKWGTRLTVAGFGLVIGGFLIARFLTGKAENILVGVATIGAYLAMAGSLFQGSRSGKFFRYYGLAVLWMLVASIPPILLLAYFEKVFPHVPAAIGGPAPRCVFVDLATKELSAETLASLLPQDLAAPAPMPGLPEVRQTRALELLFTSPEFVMLRVKATDQQPRGPVYSVAKDAIQALSTCPLDTATPAPKK